MVPSAFYVIIPLDPGFLLAQTRGQYCCRQDKRCCNQAKNGVEKECHHYSFPMVCRIHGRLHNNEPTLTAGAIKRDDIRAAVHALECVRITMNPKTPPKTEENCETERPLHPLLPHLLAQSAARHHHLCPRQVLGVRLGVGGLIALGLLTAEATTPFCNNNKRLLTIVETDGCGADGIAVATDSFVGRRTLRVEDYGKVAATLIDTHTGQAVRVAPTAVSRTLAQTFAPNQPSRWHEYLLGYQRIPDAQLVVVQAVALRQPLAEILSEPGRRTICQQCLEEVMNGREVVRVDGRILCQACAGSSYYTIP